MQLLIDLATMAVMFPGGIPVTDLSLVRGDKLPLRITLLDDGVPVTPAGVRPALAIKSTLSDDTLVLAATNLEPVDDALGPAYVGSMSVNTTQLIAAMGSDESIDLLGEVVLIAGDGSQRTSSLIRVRVRQDIMPADAVPPEDVITDWSGLIAGAVVEALPDALHEAGVELTPATGQSTLSSGDAADTWTIVGGYAFTWGDEILAGHLPDSCRLTSISTVYFFDNPALNQYCLRIWKLVDGAYSLIGTSAYVSNLSSGQTATWVFTPGVPLTRGDVIIIQVCEGTEMTPYALGMHAVLTPSVPGRGLVAEVANPPAVNGTMAPLMTVVVDYDNGITLGGMELATARQLDSLGRDVRKSSATAEAAARTAGQSAATASRAADNAATSATSAANSATAVANALAAMPQVDASGNMTLAGGLTAAGAVNANGGINIPLAVGAPTDTAAVNRFLAMGLAGAVQALIQPLYLKTSSMPVVGSGSTSVQYAGLYATSSTSAASGSPAHSTTTFTFEGPQGQHNYSSFAGFSIPLSGSTASKFTFGLGRGSKTVRGGLTMDSFSMIPGNNLAVNYGEIIDITTTAVRDSVRGGYVLRVREIYYVSSGDSWQVKTTESFIPATQNHPFPACLNRLIFMQEGLSSMSSYEGKASLYIELGGGQTNTLFKIAALRGVSGFEDGMGFSTLVADVENPNSWTSSVRTGAGNRYLYANGLINPMYAALEAMAVNAIEAEETADFEDINIPL
ncbi:hypothetical protein EYB66_07465 [Akkermansia muciniphila]|uniref:hypothetical protein n=1 Tax=Akkermansia muciniphila TaxID=239935 RepID=UPI000C9CA221|nr:hypothetical protein [Akkermansia muciniphila]PNC84710.1 hypothetical protein CXT93_05320 [Akkermansia muciniphila]PND00760.1 hypothetical protein CXT87_03045 [Akkermansia muciniphila]PND03117.1 hypothetical protein CXT86_09015 [Akkermansia muciniphila]PND11387.1 hypothetical protein CXT85_01985 [Akkermansia muciniphila]QBH17123.1 hypothetical protein EYB66_07465 [Akkermansia muciniphila]